MEHLQPIAKSVYYQAEIVACIFKVVAAYMLERILGHIGCYGLF